MNTNMTILLPLVAALLSVCSTDAFSQPSSRGIASNARSVTSPPTSTRLFSTASRPITEGISKTITVEGSGRAVRAGDIVVVKYFCNAEGSDSAFARSERQRIVAGDGSMIRGWDAAIRTMKEGERASIHITNPDYAYGTAGIPPFVPPNASVEIDLEILTVEENVGLSAQGSDTASGLETMGMDGPVNRPRTPGAIAAAYEAKMKEKAINAEPEKEGIEGFVDWIKNSYFFGLFEGETGQEAPWYLKPSITFPIAFAVVGLAFAASLAGGAIRERGMPTTDELDEIIVSSEMIRSSVAVAMSMIQV
eukprot:CAMPEP_0196130114 /NCGR_PEP_ID=MMETSP0910-20130528/590_1 /TAXON_ID=49265 /ORGANISM="Thalassiosira rotula, Strain GSO102" /LENGTH=306 /DNA_ID=CAMNT_0041389345 /DNA_START=46 /DNA_END=966 /DNA_ORIENTATION=-